MPSARKPRGSRASSRRSRVIPDILLAPDLEAGNILAKQLSFLGGADSAGLVLGARVPVILTSRADSVRSRIASCAVAMLAAHARRRAKLTMSSGSVLVLNAGSSSLKFTVYGNDLTVEAAGQIEGIGTAPRFTARTGAGARNRRRKARCHGEGQPRRTGCAGGLAAFTVCRRARARCRASGGARWREISTADGGDAAGHAGPARARSPWRPCTSLITSRPSMRSPSGWPTSPRWRVSTRVSTADSLPWPSWCRCPWKSASAVCSVTDFTAFPTNTSRRCCRAWRRPLRRGA